MVSCFKCGQGINSTYIRVGEKSILRKIGYYCKSCETHFDLDQKLYTENRKPYTVNGVANSQIIAPFDKIKSLGRDLDPGPLPYQGNALPG
jgi:hypothetical protein